MPNDTDLKQLARRVSEFVHQTHGVRLRRQQALEVVARALGYRDWNRCVHAMKRQREHAV